MSTPSLRTAVHLLASLSTLFSATTAMGESVSPPGDSRRETDASWPVLGAIRPTLELRPRVEFGKQDGRDEAVAWTFRGRFGLEATPWEQLKAFAEIEHTSTWHRDSYQAASVHGRHDGKTVIADPESTELNQAWLAYTGKEFELKGGIQRITLENQRFIGNVGWRQNEQTYHGATFTYKGIDKVKLFYGYVYNVDNIFGSGTVHNLSDRDFDSNSHLIQATYEPIPALRLTGYSYLLDLENSGTTNASNNTYGASLTGTLPAGPTTLGYRLEYARQADAADSQRDYRADYLHLYSSAKYGRFSAGAGYERLGASNGVGFQTPLATLHAFNGYADKFLVTPAKGLQDIYFEVGVKLPFDVQMNTAYHDYVAADDHTDLGYEFNVVLSKQLRWGIKALFKGAFYKADELPLTDTNKLIFQLEYVLP